MTKLNMGICQMRVWLHRAVSAKNYLLCKLAMVWMTIMFSMQPVLCTTIWNAGNTLSDDLLTKITNLYTDKLFYLLLIVNIILYFAILKDEKQKELCKKVLIGTLIAYVACKCYTIIGATLDDISTTITGSGGSGG